MTAEYCEKRSIFCKNLKKKNHKHQFPEEGGRFNLAILTSLANLRISTEVSDS